MDTKKIVDKMIFKKNPKNKSTFMIIEWIIYTIVILAILILIWRM